MTTTLTEKTFAELFTYAGGTNGSRVNAQGFIEPCATPRFDFDPITKVAKGLLIENARINQLAFSSRFENAVWAKTSVTAVPGAAQAPNGRWDACKLTLLNGGIASVGRASQTTAKAAAAITYTFSFYAKAAGSSNGWSFASGATTGERISFAFDLSALTISLFTISVFTEVSKRIVDVGGGWRRVEIVFTTDASAALTAAVYPGAAAAGTGPGDGVAGLYIWGAQLEVGAFASSYIPSWDGVTARASIGSYCDAKGILRYAAAGVARNSYEPSNRALPPVLMVEEQRTNILAKSNDMHLWSGGGMVRNTGKTAPDGSLRAAEFSGPATSPNFLSVAATSTVMTYSVYLKNVSRTAVIDLLLRNNTTAFNGAPGSVNLHSATPSISGTGWEMRDVGGGWFRCTYTSNMPIAVGDTLTCYAVASGARPDNGACLAWGAQLEAGTFATSYIPSTETFTGRASIGTYFDSTGVMKTAAAGAARMTYNPTDLSIAPWLMQEGQSTNLLLNSQIAAGVAGGTTPPLVSSETVDGEACVATTFTPAMTSTGYAGCRMQGGSGIGATVMGGTAYSSSSYVKLSRPLTGSESITMYYTGISALGSFIITAANSAQFVDRFTRAVVQNVTAAGSTSGGVYPVVNANTVVTSTLTVWICKGQVEVGPVATSYIPTTTATVTRAADAATSTAATRQADTATSAATTRAGDVIRVDTTKGWCNAAEGTLFMEFGRPREGDSSTRNLIEIGSAIANRVGIGFNTTGSAYAYSNANGVSGPSTPGVGLLGTPIGSPVKTTVSYGADGLRYGCNGQLFKAAMTTVPPMNFLGIGNLATGGNQPFLHVRSVRYQPQKLTDAEVVALTA